MTRVMLQILLRPPPLSAARLQKGARADEGGRGGLPEHAEQGLQILRSLLRDRVRRIRATAAVAGVCRGRGWAGSRGRRRAGGQDAAVRRERRAAHDVARVRGSDQRHRRRRSNAGQG